MGRQTGRRRDPRSGAALIMVLWVSAALAAMAFALSSTVRTEFDRSAYHLFSAQAEFLAEAGIDAALLRLHPRAGAWTQAFTPGQRVLRFEFPAGSVTVEIQGESGKLDVNRANAGPLAAVIAASGIDPGRATGLAASIVAFRGQAAVTPASAGAPSTFSLAGTSFGQLEDLLAVPGMTTADLYGRYERNAQGESRQIGGLHRFFTVQPTLAMDANYAAPELLLAGGISPGAVENMMAIRDTRPLEQGDPGVLELQQVQGELRFGLNTRGQAYTLRATSQVKGRAVSRTVMALVELGQGPQAPPLRIIRWYPTAF